MTQVDPNAFADAVDERFRQHEEPGEPGEGDTPSGAPDDGQENPDAGPPGDQDEGFITVNGQQLPVQDIEALLEFQAWARQNPQHMQAFGAYLEGQAEFVPKGQEQEEPKPKQDDEDWEDLDPATKKQIESLREREAELERKIQEIQQPLAAMQQQSYADQVAHATKVVNEVKQQFQEQWGLSDEEVNALEREATQAQILPAIRQQEPDLHKAVAATLETAFWRNPNYRQKAMDVELTRSGAAEQRKALASRVSGAGGSTDRGVGFSKGVDQMSEQERRDAMVAEIEESLRGTP